MKIRSEKQSFNTSRSFYFVGKNEAGDSGTVKINIEVEGITTPDMTRKLDELATETQEKAKEIIEGQEAPQQFFPEELPTDKIVDEWINQYGQNFEKLRSAGGSPSKPEQQ